MMKRSLRCSFCRRPDGDVAKLVAGPGVYICDRCTAIAVELMNAPPDATQPPAAVRPGLLARLRDAAHRVLGRRGASRTAEVAAW